MIPLENSLKIKSYPFVSFAFAVLMDSKMINSSEWICINVNICLMETIDKTVPKKIWINVRSIVYARIVSEWGKVRFRHVFVSHNCVVSPLKGIGSIYSWHFIHKMFIFQVVIFHLVFIPRHSSWYDKRTYAVCLYHIWEIK